jgi:hypothetical protein
MSGPVRLSLTRALVVAIALLVCGGLILESPLLRGDSDSSAEDWRDPGADVRVPRLADTVLVRGVIRSSLHDALHVGGAGALAYRAPPELSWRVADII